jgi:CRP-like cAMP-binding protein
LAEPEHAFLSLLAQVPMFRDLGPEPLHFLAGGCQLRTAEKGRVVCRKGHEIDGLFHLVTGRVKLAVLSEEGTERVLDIVLPGSSFGEASAFLDQPLATYAETLADSELLFVSRSRLREAVDRWSEVAHCVLRTLAARVHRLTEDLEACCLHSASRRVADFLLREAEGTGVPAGTPEVVLPAAKAVVASSLHLTPETFSRELHGLARDGVIAIDSRRIRILCKDGLRRRCSAAPRMM